METKTADLDKCKKDFLIFLLIHLLVWSGIGLIRVVLPTDSLEGIFWGSLFDFGTPKHPPMSGWISYGVYSLFKTDFSIYLLSQLFIVTGFIYIYKLAKCFLDPTKAMLSVIILEGCWAYTYITGYYGFNPDVFLLCFLPVITYTGYKCLNENKPKDWILLGILVGLCFLNKYQTALIILPLAIWALLFKRETFKNLYFYLSIIIAFLIFLPHLLWLIKYDFFPLMYFEGELSSSSWIRHVTVIFNFVLMQIAVIAGSVVIFALLKFKQKSPLNFKFESNPEAWFILLMGVFPFAAHLCMGLFTGGTMRPRWGFEFMYMAGIMLFYFLPPKTIEKDDFKFVLKGAYVAMSITFIAMATLFAVEKNYRSRYPVPLVHNDILKIWGEKYNTPLKYIGGYIEWTLPLTIYGETHPTCILDTFGYKNIWIDNDDLKKSGFMVIDRTVDELKEHFEKACNYMDENFKVEPTEYKFKLTNAFGAEREYTIYYLIVPPISSDLSQ